jgi:hypothetical protein
LLFRGDEVGHLAKLPAAGGFHNYTVAHSDVVETGGVEVVQLSDWDKAHADDQPHTDGLGGGRQSYCGHKPVTFTINTASTGDIIDEAERLCNRDVKYENLRALATLRFWVLRAA